METVTIRVLLVEDNPGDVGLIQIMLDEVRDVSFDLQHADRLSAGQEILAAGDRDVILLDLSLPDSTGLDTFAAIYALAPQTPILVLTGLDDETIAIQAVRAGAQDYLIKRQVAQGQGDLLVRAIRYAIERKRAERRVRESEARAEQLQELDRLKAQFIASASHELRTPLNAIIGLSNLLLDGFEGPLSANQRHDLETIYTSGKHLLSLVNNLLDVSQVWANMVDLSLAHVDLASVIQDVVTIARSMIGAKPIVLVQAVDPDLPMVWADATRLRQVLLNLMTNAIKYTECGQVTVSASRHEGHVEVSVSDTGIGIPPQYLDSIFEEFTRVDSALTRTIDGLGLGLTISRHLIELHGGCIWVESQLGEGSTFYFTVPIGDGYR